MAPGAEPLKKGDVVTTSATLRTIVNQENGKIVEVTGVISREGKPVMEVTSEFFYRGEYVDFNNTFQRKVETPREVQLATAKDVAVLCSKEWFHLNDTEVDLLGKTLTFRTESFVRFKNNNVFSSVETEGQVLLELPTMEVVEIGTVSYEAGASHGNPVIDYLERNGATIEQPITFENPISLTAGTELVLRAPSSNEPYANVSGDYNPIHVSRIFSKYADFRYYYSRYVLVCCRPLL